MISIKNHLSTANVDSLDRTSRCRGTGLRTTLHWRRTAPRLPAMFKLSQETIAIVTVGLALAGLDVTSDNGNPVRDAGHAHRSPRRPRRSARRGRSRMNVHQVLAGARGAR